MTKNTITPGEAMKAIVHERFASIVDTETAGTGDDDAASVIARFSLGLRSAQESVRRLQNLLHQGAIATELFSAVLYCGLEAAFFMQNREQAEDWFAECETLSAISTEDKIAAKVEIALAFDDRELAEKLVSESPANDAERYVAAKFAYVQGDFDRAKELLGTMAGQEERRLLDIKAVRLAAQVHAGDRDFAEEAKSIESLLVMLPSGHRSDRERLDLAAAYTAQGSEEGLAHAEEHLKILASGEEQSGIAQYAEKRLEYLETARKEQEAGGEPRHCRLPFPTVHQKRNYCGPAVLELCLRSLGIELGQDEIAGVVKRENGTPMYEIVAFLQDRDIEARRVVATLERLKAAIDLGLPVILQEEYSTTCHVAVVTGYDDRLGLFVCQDPMTHRAQLKSYEWVQNSGQLFGNGVVVVVGRKAELDEELLAALEKAELVSHDAFAILDEADRMRASARGTEQEVAVVHEVLAACERALQSDPEYQLAWHRRAWSELYRYKRDSEMRRQAQRSVHMARISWVGAEWPHQLHASMLEHEGRFREAYVEHLAAHRCDEQDGDNLASMSHCQGLLGDVADGIENGHHALRVFPSHAWAAAELAVQYTQVLESSSTSAWSDTTKVSWVTLPPERPCHQILDLKEAEVFNRLAFYTKLALQQQPENISVLTIWSVQAALQGEFSQACKRLWKALEFHPNAMQLLLAVVRASLLNEDQEQADKALALLLEHHPGEYRSWLAAAECCRENTDKAWEVLVKGASSVGRHRFELVSALFKAGHSKGGGNEAASVLLHGVSEQFAGDASFVKAVADQIDSVGQRGLAVQLYRRVVESEAGDLTSRYRLATLLSDDPLTMAEGREALKEVLQMAPSATVVRVRLACCLWDDPEAGLEVLAPAMEEGNARVYETASRLLFSLGNADAGVEMHQKALGTFPSEDDARVELGAWHYYSDRYDFSIDILAPLTKRAFAGTGDVLEAQSTILTAYRLSGRIAEIESWVKELCKESVPEHLAFEVFWAFRSEDYDLAGRAARKQAELASDASTAFGHEADAASCDAKLGEYSTLEVVIAKLNAAPSITEESQIDAWETVYHSYARVREMGKARAALDKMRSINKDARATLTTNEDFATKQGNPKEAFANALRLRELYPYQHIGDERLGMLYGISSESEKAVEHAGRALRIAPYCHLSQQSGALAFFSAGDVERAKMHMERAEALDITEFPLQWSAFTALMHAMRGDRTSFEACIRDRDESGKNYPYPDFEKALRQLFSGAET